MRIRVQVEGFPYTGTSLASRPGSTNYSPSVAFPPPSVAFPSPSVASPSPSVSVTFLLPPLRHPLHAAPLPLLYHPTAEIFSCPHCGHRTWSISSRFSPLSKLAHLKLFVCVPAV